MGSGGGVSIRGTTRLDHTNEWCLECESTPVR